MTSLRHVLVKDFHSKSEGVKYCLTLGERKEAAGRASQLHTVMSSYQIQHEAQHCEVSTEVSTAPGWGDEAWSAFPDGTQQFGWVYSLWPETHRENQGERERKGK